MALARRRSALAAGMILAALAAQRAPAQDASVNLPPLPGPPAQAGCCPVHNRCCHPRWRGHGDGRNSRCVEKRRAAYLGYPDQWYSPPLGTFLYNNAKGQVANGTAARMVLYDYDFVADSYRLSVKGQDQLAKITRLVGESFAPIIVERTPYSPGLAEARRQSVLTELARVSQFPIPAERVIVGRPPAYGLSGVHAEAIDLNQQNRTSIGGPPVSNSAAGSGPGGPGAAAPGGLGGR